MVDCILLLLSDTVLDWAVTCAGMKPADELANCKLA